MTPQVLLRPADEADLPAINGIYNHYVLHSTCTYQETPETPAARRDWFSRHGPRHPVIVAEYGKEVVGWGSLSPWNPRSAYRLTVEDSVYIRHDQVSRGIGSTLLARLIELAGQLDHHTIIGGVDTGQEASLRLHEKFGFVRCAHFRRVGFKFGRWLDVIYLQLMLRG